MVSGTWLKAHGWGAQPDAQTKKIILVSVATGLNIPLGELSTRLNNKEKLAPAPTQGPDKTDAETAEYLQREKEVSTAVDEQEKAEEECRKLTEAMEAGRFKAEAARAKAVSLRKNKGLAWNRSISAPADNMETENL